MQNPSKNLEHVQQIREYELDQVRSWIPEGSRVLEIGAGSGWQAKALAESGFDVEAVDVEGSHYAESRIWPVQIYDGAQLPFPNADFDVVFSSNVLEHIPHVEAFQDEIRRVLRPQGIAVHLMPTATWRIWTIVSFYQRAVRRLFGALRRTARSVGAETTAIVGATRRHSKSDLLRMALLPPRHGERGNVVTEILWFSRFRWLALFRRTHWRIVSLYPSRLFYTGGVIHGSNTSLRARRRLSRVLGSSCLVYVVAPGPPPAPHADEPPRS